MIKRHDIRPRRKKAANGARPSGATPDIEDDEEVVSADRD
jgi:hypothetical protein